MNFISLLFCLELFTIAVALVTLYGDSLGEFLSSTPSNAQLTGSTETVAPAYPANFYKILGLIVFVALAVIINVGADVLPPDFYPLYFYHSRGFRLHRCSEYFPLFFSLPSF